MKKLIYISSIIAISILSYNSFGAICRYCQGSKYRNITKHVQNVMEKALWMDMLRVQNVVKDTQLQDVYKK